MTIFALEQAVSNGCQLDITDADSALEEVAALRDEHERLKNDAAIFYEAAAGLLATNDALRAQLAEAQRRIKELETPTMFWDFNNPEHEAFDSPYYAICDGDFDEGAEVSFMTARSLPTKTVRVTRDSEGNYDYEYIDAAKETL